MGRRKSVELRFFLFHFDGRRRLRRRRRPLNAARRAPAPPPPPPPTLRFENQIKKEEETNAERIPTEFFPPRSLGDDRPERFRTDTDGFFFRVFNQFYLVLPSFIYNYLYLPTFT